MIKIVIISLVFAVLIVYLKSINSELYTLAIICSGIIMLYLGLSYLINTFEFLKKITKLSGINNEYLKVIFKITSIGFLIEFGAQTVEDMGLKSLADKLVFIGKLIILSVSLPVFYALINLLSGLQ